MMRVVFKVSELAVALNVKEATVRTWIKQGKVKAFKAVGHWRVNHSEFQRLLLEGIQ